MDRRKHIRRGFSLVEAAIVLGVVGLVIGGIWIASAKFYEDYKVNKTVSDLHSIVKNVQRLISLRDAEAMGNVSIIPLLKSSNAIPEDWTDNSSSINIKTPVGGTVWIGSDASYFYFEIHQLTPSICMKIIIQASSIAALSGSNRGSTAWGTTESRPFLGRIRVNNPAWATDYFPVSPQQAKTACNQSDNDVIFYYSYTRIN